jgi:hypothetical protein
MRKPVLKYDFASEVSLFLTVCLPVRYIPESFINVGGGGSEYLCTYAYMKWWEIWWEGRALKYSLGGSEVGGGGSNNIPYSLYPHPHSIIPLMRVTLARTAEGKVALSTAGQSRPSNDPSSANMSRNS